MWNWICEEGGILNGGRKDIEEESDDNDEDDNEDDDEEEEVEVTAELEEDIDGLLPALFDRC